MSLTIEYTSNLNVFEWAGLRCPVCGRNKYTSTDCSSVWCDYCNAKFETSHTGGDPGVVVHVTTEWIHAPKFKCPSCFDKDPYNNPGFGSYETEPKCPKCGMAAVREENVWRGIGKDRKESNYSLVLKIGDYCSRWTYGEGVGTKMDYPTQEEWDDFVNDWIEKKNK